MTQKPAQVDLVDIHQRNTRRRIADLEIFMPDGTSLLSRIEGASGVKGDKGDQGDPGPPGTNMLDDNWYEHDMAVSAKSLVTPGAITIDSGTFVARRSTVYIDAKGYASMLETLGGYAALNLLLAHSSVASPLNDRKERLGAWKTGVNAVRLGGVNARPAQFGNSLRISGLTVGETYKWELTVAIVGFMFPMPLGTGLTMKSLVASKTTPSFSRQMSVSAELYDTIFAAVSTNKLWAIRSNLEQSPLADTIFTADLPSSTLRQAAISRDGRWIVVTGYNTNDVYVVDLNAASPSATVVTNPGSKTAPWGVAIADNGVAYVSWTGQQQVIPLTLSTLTWGTPFAAGVGAMKITPDQTKLVMAGFDNSVKVANLDGTPQVDQSVSGAAVSDIAITPDSTTAYLVFNGTVRSFNLSTGALGAIVQVVPDSELVASGAEVLSDGKTLFISNSLTGSGKRVSYQVNLPLNAADPLYVKWPNSPDGEGSGANFNGVALTQNGGIAFMSSTGVNLWFGGSFNLRATAADNTAFWGEFFRLHVIGATAT